MIPTRASDRIREKTVHKSPITQYEEMEEDRGGIDSDLDEQLTEFDESDMDSLTGADGEADPANLVHLTEACCRVPCNIKVASSAKSVRSICGRPADVCKRHKVKRAQGGRQAIGYYARVFGSGQQVHGKLGNVFVSVAQMNQDLMRDKDEMGDHLRAQVDDIDSDEDIEIENLRRLQALQEHRQDNDSQRSPLKNVAFGGEETRSFPTPPSLSNPLPPPTLLHEADPRRLEIPFRGLSIRKKTKEDKPEEKEVWAGMLDPDGHRQMVSGLLRALAFVNDHQWTLVRTFTRMEDSLEWASQSPERKVQSPPPPRRATTRRSNESPKQPKDTSADNSTVYHRAVVLEQSDDSEARRGSRSRMKKKKSTKDRRQRKRQGRRRRRRSPSSSSSSSTSSSSSRDESYYRERRKNSRRGGRSSSSDSDQESRNDSRRHHRSSKHKPVNTASVDVSKGQKNYVFEKDVTGTAIDKVIGPEGLSAKDADQLYNLAVDVASLPGMYISRQDNNVDEDAEATRTTQMAATLLATAINKRAQIHDSLWKTRSRHGLKDVKDEASFFELVQSVGKAEKHAFEHQEICLRGLLAKRHYDQRSVDNYVQHGLLLRITRDSFQYYKDLLNHARELQYRHKGVWEGGPAESMISYHSKELYAIRLYAPSKKVLVLRTYTYLRDVKAKSFYDESMTEALWDRFAALSKAQQLAGTMQESEEDKLADGRPKGGGRVASPVCSHCKSKTLHTMFGAAPYKRSCPLKDQGDAIARRMVGVIIKKHEEDPKADLQGMRDQVVATWR
jgi:hypothetical protein